MPDLLDRPTLVTLADVQERLLPHYFSAAICAFGPSPTSCRARRDRAVDHLEFSKQSIRESFGVASDKVTVTHLAADAIDEVTAAWPADLGLPSAPYFLYPANLYPHKNHTLLFDSLQLLRSGLECACVLTGQPVQGGADVGAERGPAAWTTGCAG